MMANMFVSPCSFNQHFSESMFNQHVFAICSPAGSCSVTVIVCQILISKFSISVFRVSFSNLVSVISNFSCLI